MGYLKIRIDSSGGAGGPRVAKGVVGGNRPGTFTSAATEFRQRNLALGRAVQAEVVENIQERITRPEASTNRLVKVTAAPENLIVTVGRIEVGIEDYLDRSQAKYWRTFEQGSASSFDQPFVGTPLRFAGKRNKGPSAHGQTPGIRTAKVGQKANLFVTHEIEPRHAYRDAAAAVPSKANADIARYLDQISNLPLIDF